jgi:cytochrome c biogenesis protein CcmG, thiol:disulfide interchange protein DsbE
MTRAALLVAAALVLAGCGATPSGAGTPVTTSAATMPPASTGSPVSAPADLVTQVALQPCPTTASSPGPTAEGRALPDLTLACLGTGPAVALRALGGTPTVINVWAAWCTQCRAELPMLAHLAASTPSVRVLGVDAIDDPSSALSLLAQAGVHYPSVRDDAGSTKADLQWASGLPVTLFVRADGTVAYQQHGALQSQAQLDDLVAQHLGVAAGG